MGRRRQVNLTRLESEVMRAVWEADPEPVRVREVVEALNRGRSRTLAYNTIQTILTILKEKAVVRQVRGPGRAHHYRAQVSRETASRHMVGDLAARLFGGPVQPLLHQLIDDAKLDAEQLQDLRDWVDQRLRDADEEAGR